MNKKRPYHFFKNETYLMRGNLLIFDGAVHIDWRPCWISDDRLKEIKGSFWDFLIKKRRPFYIACLIYIKKDGVPEVLISIINTPDGPRFLKQKHTFETTWICSSLHKFIKKQNSYYY